MWVSIVSVRFGNANWNHWSVDKRSSHLNTSDFEVFDRWPNTKSPHGWELKKSSTRISVASTKSPWTVTNSRFDFFLFLNARDCLSASILLVCCKHHHHNLLSSIVNKETFGNWFGIEINDQQFATAKSFPSELTSKKRFWQLIEKRFYEMLKF